MRAQDAGAMMRAVSRRWSFPAVATVFALGAIVLALGAWWASGADDPVDGYVIGAVIGGLVTGGVVRLP